MWWAKLNAHSVASGNVCACSRIPSRNGWHKISGTCYECRCRICWPRPTYWTQRKFLGLEYFLINAFHLVDQGQKERSLGYISGTSPMHFFVTSNSPTEIAPWSNLILIIMPYLRACTPLRCKVSHLKRWFLLVLHITDKAISSLPEKKDSYPPHHVSFWSVSKILAWLNHELNCGQLLLWLQGVDDPENSIKPPPLFFIGKNHLEKSTKRPFGKLNGRSSGPIYETTEANQFFLLT